MLCYNGDVLMLSYNVRNFEWPPVYGTYRPILFFRIFRIACPPRTVNLTTARSDKKTPGKDQPERQTKMDKRNLTAGRENQVRRRTVHRQTSYCTGERLHSQQDLTAAVHRITRYVYTSANTILDYSNTRFIKPPPP